MSYSKLTFCKNNCILICFFSYLFLMPTLGFADASHVDYDKSCTGKLSMKKIVACVLDHSPERKSAEAEIKISLGKKKAAGYLFPSNPILSGGSSYRNQLKSEGGLLDSSKQSDVNGEVSISQEFFIGGQRGLKMDVAEAEFQLLSAKKDFTIRNIKAEAISAAIHFTGSEAEWKLAEELFKISQDTKNLIATRAEKGLSAPFDASLAEYESLRMYRYRQFAKRKFDGAKGNLTIMMGLPFTSEIAIFQGIGTLPVSGGMDELADRAVKLRKEVTASEFAVLAEEKQLSLLQREKIPNLSVAGFWMRDGFSENVVGGRLSLPLKVWKDNSGEIEESKGKKEKFRNISEVQKHTVRMEVIKAVSNFLSLKEEQEIYTDEMAGKLEKNMGILRKATMEGKLNLREALLAQQSLINAKIASLQSRTEFLLSVVELYRATGEDLDSLLPDGGQ